MMTPLKALFAAAGLALGLVAVSEPAYAHGKYRHGYRYGPSVNFSFGYWGGPRYWGGPYYGSHGYWGPGWGYGAPPAVIYGPPAVVVVPQEPRVWVESDQAAATPPPPAASNSNANAPQWWYWCASTQNYYPYASSCAEGWQRVAPQPVQGTQ